VKFYQSFLLYDQNWLIERIIELAEATEQNGIIVALDHQVLASMSGTPPRVVRATPYEVISYSRLADADI
jgi:hypothetical protein